MSGCLQAFPGLADGGDQYGEGRGRERGRGTVADPERLGMAMRLNDSLICCVEFAGAQSSNLLRCIVFHCKRKHYTR